jgi:hypothetical protein
VSHTSTSDQFQILAIDGGGFRGLFAAKCLAEWEAQTGRRTADCFDLICGTSTGGIIAMGIGLGIPAQKLVDFYLEDGRRIFPVWWPARTYAWFRRWLFPKLSATRLRKAVQQRLGRDAKFGDSLTRLLIPSYDLSVGKPYLFKTDHHPSYKYDWQRPMWEIALATSAAPTYFRYHVSSWKTAYIDGGVWANNPSQLGAIEATEILGHSPKVVRILNLGTGTPDQGNGLPPLLRRLGIAGWATAIPNVILNANALAVAGIAQRTFGENYVRVTPAVSNRALPLDRYAPDHLMALAIDQTRIHAGTANAFFSHSAPAYSKNRVGSAA